MVRLRRLLAGCEGGALQEQIGRFLERVALSITEGQSADRNRVNLLTLHSTKGLEFSRVYVVGVEDAQFMPGERPSKQFLQEMGLTARSPSRGFESALGDRQQAAGPSAV